MKKIVLLALALVVGMTAANAQFGNLIRKAAQKTAEKAVDKAVDRATEEADKAVDRELDKVFTPQDENSKSTKNNSTPQAEEENPTYESIMRQALEMPTVQQLINHKGYELNEQSFKLITSPVTRYVTNISMLSLQMASLSYSNVDSAQAVETAYDMASRYSGLSRQEIEKLQTMSEAEQEAYLKAHYSEGRAEAAILNDAADAAKYLEPLQPTIDRWNEVGERADRIIADAEEKCNSVYSKYSDRIASATGKDKNELILKYYSEVCPIKREAALESMRIRVDEQLPIAEELEREMVKIRAKHKDYIAHLLNYPMLTATQCLSATSFLTDIPTGE